MSLASLPANVAVNDPDVFPGLIFADNFHSMHQGVFARGTPITTPTNVCLLPRGKYAVNPGDATGNKLKYVGTNSVPQGDASIIVEWRADRAGTVATARVLLESAVAANDNNRTRVEITANASTIRVTHSKPDGSVHAYVEGAITGGLVAGQKYRWLIVRDDDGATESAYLAIYQWVSAAWSKISGSLTNAWTAHDAVPTELRVGNDRAETVSAWGAYEAVYIKDEYDPTWNPTDTSDSTWAAVYKNGGLDADKTTGGDSATATVTGFVAVDLKSDAMWQNRDNVANYLTVTVPKALGANRGAFCMDITPLVLPAAARWVLEETGTSVSNNNETRLQRRNSGKLWHLFYDSGGTYEYAQTTGTGHLVAGTRTRLSAIVAPDHPYFGVDGELVAVTYTGTKGLRDGRSGTIALARDSVAGFPFLIENIFIYADAQGTDAWCMKELNFARSHGG